MIFLQKLTSVPNLGLLSQKLANPPLNLPLHFLIGIPFSTFSTFYKFIIFFINLLTLYNKYGHFVLIRLDQICPKWIKLDQMCIFHLSKNVAIKSCQIYLKNNHDQLFLTRSDEICPKWIKTDQTWSNFDFSPIKKR